MGSGILEEARAGLPAGSSWVILLLVVAAVVAVGVLLLLRRKVAPSASDATDEQKIIDATFAIGGTISVFALIGVLGALVACLGMAKDPRSFASFFGADVLVAAAAGSVGAVFGFIFGIPRTLDPVSRVAVAGAASQGGPAATTSAVLAANTNLERVSDWLTTLLIGATLVQIREIPGWMKSLADYLGTGEITNAKIVPFIAVYFFGLAFLGVYLITRLYLTTALTQTLGLLTGGDGISDVTVVRTMLSNARANTDADAMASTLGMFDRWSFRGDRSDPSLNAELARLLAKYLSTGKADNVAARTVQLRTALGKVAVDSTVKDQLKAEFDNKTLTTGDTMRDTELRKALD